ncbi:MULTISPECIES: cyanophycinase [unclassified Allobranchiibius]|uniref:cyanophycinase n=1 Tax=unclassified Allobranchiibius TaxID=2649857 RepID=UPI001AA1BEC4|nr:MULTISPECIES: cyanophycinase [unclassified Allobranchiibius]MBO1766504.1 cyanophycinase [Allobranchiibius sp. GilTou38]UIJ33898.1 cyanophycinase [Allobranchiibius sp. GilTou73]
MPDAPKRSLLIIGGAEDKVGRVTILRRFVRLAGGRKARLVVIPTASSVPDEVVEVYSTVFERLGCASVTSVDPANRQAAGDSELVDRVDDATGVFLSGGNQLKLSQLIVGTPLGAALLRAYQRGAVVAGTSAGASIMSQFMISMGDEGVTPRQRSSQLTAGLGLLPGVIVDQHFDQRARYGRLLSLVAGSPSLLGMGIDEDTAAEITDDAELTVVGSGAVFVIDARNAVTDAHEARRDAPLLVTGAVVHTLPFGSTFDLQTATLTEFVEKHTDLSVSSSRDRHDTATAAAALRH